MSRVLIVYYELSAPAANSQRFTQKIKSYEAWARLGNSAYLLYTDMEPVEVRDDLQTVLFARDRLFVGAAPAPSAWRGLPDEVANWILGWQK